MDQDYEQYLVRADTTHTAKIKTLVSVLKVIIPETTLIFTPNGIEISQQESTAHVIVHMQLLADRFTNYHFKPRQNIRIGINTTQLYNAIRCLPQTDVISFVIKDPDYCHDDEALICTFGIMTHNADGNRTTTIWLNSHDEQDSIYQMDSEYPITIEIKSDELQRIISQFAKLGGVETLQITYAKNVLQFSAKGDVSKSETQIINVNSTDNNFNEIINVHVNLRMVVAFVKCYPLSSIARLMIYNEIPLMIEYNVGDLGFVRLGITQKRPDNDL